MNTHYDCIVIGAGQAGLAAGYYLKRARLQFTLLDAAEEIGSSWRQRWDSLRLFTPAGYDGLPGLPFPGERYCLPGKDDVADYLAAYAMQFELPVRLQTPVTHLRSAPGGYSVGTGRGEDILARAVIVATGATQRPYIPLFAAGLDPAITQVHSSAYRRPEQLPAGTVLVVGAGNSGVQIALELSEAGRRVVLSGPDTGFLPRRFLGRDVYDWLWPTIMRPPVDTILGRYLTRGKRFAGDPIVGVSPRAPERAGITRKGRTIGAQEGLPVFEGGSLGSALSAVVWCTGFRPDYGWIELPVLGLDGYPVHHRGLAPGAPGIAFLGMRHQYRLGSALLGGVGEDASYVASETVGYLHSMTAGNRVRRQPLAAISAGPRGVRRQRSRRRWWRSRVV